MFVYRPDWLIFPLVDVHACMYFSVSQKPEMCEGKVNLSQPLSLDVNS